MHTVLTPAIRPHTPPTALSLSPKGHTRLGQRRLDSVSLAITTFGHQHGPNCSHDHHHDDNNKPHTHSPHQTEVSYPWTERVASRFKLKKLIINPLALRLESNLFWSIGIGLIAGLATGVGFALTPPIFLGLSILTVIAGFFSKKPLDLAVEISTLSEEQKTYKETYTPTIQTLGKVYQTLGSIAAEYKQDFAVKHNGEMIQRINLGLTPEDFTDGILHLINLYDQCEQSHQPLQKLDQLKTFPPSKLTQAFEGAQWVSRGGYDPQKQNKRIQDLTNQKEGAVNLLDLYQQLKRHRKSLVELAELGKVILTLPQASQAGITASGTLSAEALSQFRDSLPTLNDEETITADSFNTFLNGYQKSLTSHQTLLQENHQLLQNFFNAARKTLLKEASNIRDFQIHYTPNIIT